MLLQCIDLKWVSDHFTAYRNIVSVSRTEISSVPDFCLFFSNIKQMIIFETLLNYSILI